MRHKEKTFGICYKDRRLGLEIGSRSLSINAGGERKDTMEQKIKALIQQAIDLTTLSHKGRGE
ncbi:MAG: hypothetical protein ACYC6G_15440 [Desulfobaccales bacterium]